VDGGERGRGRSGRRRPGPTDERAEDRYASTAGAGATAPTRADGTASSKGAPHRAEHSEGVSPCTQRRRSAGGSVDELPTLEALKAIVLKALPPRPAPQQVSKLEEWQPTVEALLDQRLGPQAIHDRLRLEHPDYQGSVGGLKRLVRRIPSQPWRTARRCDDSGRHGAGRLRPSGLRIRGKAVGFGDGRAAQGVGFRDGAGLQPSSILRGSFSTSPRSATLSEGAVGLPPPPVLGPPGLRFLPPPNSVLAASPLRAE
jgi:hypothetical protein